MIQIDDCEDAGSIPASSVELELKNREHSNPKLLNKLRIVGRNNE